MLAVIPFPEIDPNLIEIGPLAIRWYALAYIAGLLIGWLYCRRLALSSPHGVTPEALDDFFIWAVVGVVLGGRLGYVLFYNLDFFLAEPWQIAAIWRGGMSFHGGFLGVVLAIALFARRRGISILALGDIVAVAAPIGLFFGRLANFINGELYGRPSEVPWAMVFPHGGPEPRHPSQLYEALLEGVLLYFVLFFLWRIPALRARAGFMIGAFAAGYGAARAFVELFRQPDEHIGFLSGGLTMGQLLSLPMFIAGLALMLYALWRKAADGRAEKDRA